MSAHVFCLCRAKLLLVCTRIEQGVAGTEEARRKEQGETETIPLEDWAPRNIARAANASHGAQECC